MIQITLTFDNDADASLVASALAADAEDAFGGPDEGRMERIREALLSASAQIRRGIAEPV